MQLSEPQGYLLPNVEKYQGIVGDICDAITDIRAGYDIPCSLTKGDIDWLNFNFYPALQRNLD